MLCDGHVPYFNTFLKKNRSLKIQSLSLLGEYFQFWVVCLILCSLFNARDKYMRNKQLHFVSSYNAHNYGLLLLYFYVRKLVEICINHYFKCSELFSI